MEEFDVRLPDEWKSWKLTEYIGKGAYGKVYKAEKSLGGLISVSAIKVLDIPDADSEIDPLLIEKQRGAAFHIYSDMVRDIMQEIRYMESLKGITNIVSIEDFYMEHEEDQLHWRIFIRMEFLKSLREFLIENTMEEEETIRLGMDMCTALKYCSQKSIIHRDIKPDNIFISDAGDFKLGDFGIARQMSQTVGAYSSKGTFSYMAPEIYHGKSYGTSVDIYSVGILLYRLMNEFRVPFVDSDRQLVSFQDMKEALQRRMDGEELPPPSQASEAFARVILKACAFEPEDRYETAEDFRKALEKLQKGKENKAPEKTPAENQPVYLQEDSGFSFDLDREIERIAPQLKLSPKGILSFRSRVLREYEKQVGEAYSDDAHPGREERQFLLKRCFDKVFAQYVSWAEKHHIPIRR